MRPTRLTIFLGTSCQDCYNYQPNNHIVVVYQILINEWMVEWIYLYGEKCRKHEKKVSRRLHIGKLLQSNRARRQRQWHSSTWSRKPRAKILYGNIAISVTMHSRSLLIHLTIAIGFNSVLTSFSQTILGNFAASRRLICWRSSLPRRIQIFAFIRVHRKPIFLIK